MNIPQDQSGQVFFYFRRDLGRVFHLGIGGDDDIALAGALDGALRRSVWTVRSIVVKVGSLSNCLTTSIIYPEKERKASLLLASRFS